MKIKYIGQNNNGILLNGSIFNVYGILISKDNKLLYLISFADKPHVVTEQDYHLEDD